jgi:starch phosphorylase
MANLAIVTSHHVNGVAAIHSEILKKDVFSDFSQLWPDKFLNITNGVTPRRWLVQCNPGLADVITAWLKSSNWPLNLGELAGLRHFAENSNLQKKWIDAKRECKMKLAKLVEKQCNVVVDVDSLFDIQVKRIHEYKRQLMNIL